MSKKLAFKIGVIFVASGVVVFSFGQGCNNAFNIKSTGNFATSAGVGVESPILPYSSDPVSVTKKTASVVYGKQILEHYLSCLGVKKASDRTLAMYDAKKGSISEFGNVASITAPMLMASVAIAGEVCEDLILQEKDLPNNCTDPETCRRIFTHSEYDFAGQMLPGSSAVQEVIKKLSRSCWSRNALNEEIQILETNLSAAYTGSATGVNRVHDAALFLCTSMLSSLETILL